MMTKDNERLNSSEENGNKTLHVHPELQVRRGNRDKSKDNFSYFSMKTCIETPH